MRSPSAPRRAISLILALGLFLVAGFYLVASVDAYVPHGPVAGVAHDDPLEERRAPVAATAALEPSSSSPPPVPDCRALVARRSAWGVPGGRLSLLVSTAPLRLIAPRTDRQAPSAVRSPQYDGWNGVGTSLL
jgi:hypothetical protein